ncbi:hypothetical protein [Amycolatopsis sp. NBC_01480]|uniref:hypothetical protein n=1 Tax=Amycolatopsis sp. NBC_01480 TaxID=2903562 RepID=UPI002E2C5477|nr:hypothetical protein [Amycolatopsis sp. NBC_01480]
MTEGTTRPAPPPLIHRNPECPLCCDETSGDGTCFWCAYCGATWPVTGDGDGEWSDVDAARCTSVIRPFVEYDPVKYQGIAGTRYRCYLDAGHDGKHTHPDHVYGWTAADACVADEAA